MSSASVLSTGQVFQPTTEGYPLRVTHSAATIAGAQAFAERARKRELLEPVEVYVNPLSSYPSVAPPPPQHYPCRHGNHGINCNGGNGEHSKPGRNGQQGMDNLNMQQHVSQSGSNEYRFYFYNTQQTFVLSEKGFLLLDGRGQAGSKGGDASIADSNFTAGDGGRGGAGHAGTQHHLNGGHGFNGGQGGDSSYGGHGGKSGNSSAIFISVPRACLPALVLLEMNIVATPGSAPGSNSRPGLGGKGGAGGSAYSYTEKKPDGRTVTHKGKSGRRGRDGKNGRQCKYHGLPGAMGAQGVVTYGVIEADGRTTYSNSLFQANTVTFEIVDEDDDGIVSPCSVAFLRGLEIENQGGLSLEYAFADIQAQHPATVEMKYEAVPSILPNQRVTIPSTWELFAPPMLEPSHMPYSATYTINPRVTVLGRTLIESLVSTVLKVQYPVRIEKEIRCSNYMGPNEITVMEIDVMNISRKMYGGGAQSLGEVTLRLRVDNMLEIVNLPTLDPAFVQIIEQDGKSAMCVLPPMQPHSTNIVKFAVKCLPGAAARLFTNMPCMVDLELKGQPIEYRRHEIRIVPVFLSMQTDVMLVTSPAVTREEFVGYSYLLQALSLSVNIYDLERYNGFQPNWVGMCRTIVYLSQTNNTQSLLQFLSFSDLYTHLNTNYSADASITNIPQTGLLVIGKQNADVMSLLYDLHKPIRGLRENLVSTTIPMLDYNPIAQLADIPANQLPPTFNYPNFNHQRNIPAIQVLQTPPVPASVDVILSDTNAKHAAYTVKGCGSCCSALCCCFECASNDGEVMLRRLHQRVTKADTTRQYMFLHKDNVAKSEINNKGCFSSETKPIGVYSSLYQRDIPVIWLQTDQKLNSDTNLPYTFDGKQFTSRTNQPWKQGMFLDILRALVALLPIHRRVALLSEPFISSQQFELQCAATTCGLDMIVGMSLCRSVLMEQKINETSPNPQYKVIEALQQTLPKVLLGNMVYPLLYSVLGPHVTCPKIRSQAESLARVVDVRKDNVHSAMKQFQKELLPKITHFSTWSKKNDMFYPADNDNTGLLNAPYTAGEYPYVRSYKADVFTNAAFAWTYSINAYKSGGLIDTRTNVPVPVHSVTLDIAPAPEAPPSYYSIEETKIECLPNTLVDNGWLERQQSVSLPTKTIFSAPLAASLSVDDKNTLPPDYSFPAAPATQEAPTPDMNDDMFESAPPVYDVVDNEDETDQQDES